MKRKCNGTPDLKVLYKICSIAGLVFAFLIILSITGHSHTRYVNVNLSSYLTDIGPGNGQGVNWKAPASADEIKNPYKSNAAETAKGKTLYTQMCVICHGKSGKGDGPAGLALNPRPADHTSAKVQDQSDGALFWKMTNGNPPMAAYKDVLSEEQRWDLVNYIRTLKK